MAGTSTVRNAWARKQPLTVHGWIYDLHDGLLIDLGAPAWIFYTSAIFTVLCIVVMVTSAKYSGGGPKNTVNATTEATPAP